MNRFDDLDFDSMPSLHEAIELSGLGMWENWTRAFRSSVSAFLDLLDNCFDATLDPPDMAPPFRALVEVDYLNSKGDEGPKRRSSGITIMNNSFSPIGRLKEVLTLCHHGKTANWTIGKNGVGLKQGCAALSDTSFVLTRNPGQEFSFGIIAKTLQTPSSAYLPSFCFQVDLDGPLNSATANPAAADAGGSDGPIVTKKEAFQYNIWEQVKDRPEIQGVIAAGLGDGNVEDGVKNLAFQFIRMWQGKWENEDKIFQVILCNLDRSSDEDANYGAGQGDSGDGNGDAIESVSAKDLLDDLKRILPQKYVNVPSSLQGFDFCIDDTPVSFSHWENRLVELTKFTVDIPNRKKFEEIGDDDWAKGGYKGSYELDIYCGFDPIRLRDNQEGKYTKRKGIKTKTKDITIKELPGEDCSLYIYSRRRLIVHQKDARSILGISASGAYNRQGLTIVVDDVGKLPLTPTKQEIAWNEQRHGKVHEKNFYAWVGGVAACFWEEHYERIKSAQGPDEGKRSTGSYNHTIVSFVAKVEKNVEKGRNRITKGMRDAKLTEYQDVVWERRSTSIRREKDTPTRIDGSDTLFKLSDKWIQDRCKEFDEDKKKKKAPEKENGARRRSRGKASKRTGPVELEEKEETDKTKGNRSSRKKTLNGDDPKKSRADHPDENEKNRGKRKKGTRGTSEEDDPTDSKNGEHKGRSIRPRRQCRMHNRVDYKDADEFGDDFGRIDENGEEEPTRATGPWPASVVSSPGMALTGRRNVEDDGGLHCPIELSSDEESIEAAKIKAAGPRPASVVSSPEAGRRNVEDDGCLHCPFELSGDEESEATGENTPIAHPKKRSKTTSNNPSAASSRGVAVDEITSDPIDAAIEACINMKRMQLKAKFESERRDLEHERKIERLERRIERLKRKSHYEQSHTRIKRERNDAPSFPGHAAANPKGNPKNDKDYATDPDE